MKITLLATLALVSSLSAMAALPSQLDGHLDRELVFNITPNDAVKCGQEIIGDHLKDASVSKVIHTTEQGLYVYYEITDRSNFIVRCQETTLQKLTGYFDSVNGSIKTKNIQRVFQSTSNAVECLTESEPLIVENTSKMKYIVVKKVYGQRERTAFANNEITHEIYSPNGKKLGSCDKLNTTAKVASLDSTFTDPEDFNSRLRNLSSQILNKSKNSYGWDDTVFSVGICRVKVSASKANYTLNVEKISLLNPISNVESTSERAIAGLDAHLKAVITPEECMMQN